MQTDIHPAVAPSELDGRSALDGAAPRSVRLLYSDLHGVARGKDIPVARVRPRRSSAGSASARR